jgi:ATP-dependent RNA helicase DeaD
MGLRPELAQAVADLGYQEPTPIQTAIIPLLLAGRDVIGQAQTGTGKTAAFALPILHNLDADHSAVQACVLAPTRELALQVAQAFKDYSRHTQIRVLAVYGGQSYSPQINALRRGVDVVVGTPGRLLDLLRQGSLDLSNVRTLVLDEADEMLSMGFIEDIEAILAATPAERQTALFSATLPPPVRNLADKYLHSPEAVTIQRDQVTVAAIEQRYYLVNEADKLAALTRLFEVEPVTSALIFARTRVASGELANELTVRGFPAEVLNGDLQQDARERVMSRFRNHQIKVLVATDVAARGLDIEDISHVFNFDLPGEAEIYVHRIGRTGRAGKTGIAISLVTPKEQGYFRRIESFMRVKAQRCQLPTEAEIIARREDELLEQMKVWLNRARYRRERELVGRLVEEGFDPLEIASAALKIARADEKQRPVASLSEVIDRPPHESRRREPTGERRPRDKSTHGRTSHETGMVRLVLSRGKVHGLRPNLLVSTIAYHAGIPGDTIGKIHIQEQNTLFDVPEQYAARVLANSGNYRILRQPVTVELA